MFTKEQTDRIADEVRALLVSKFANRHAIHRTCVECLNFDAEREHCTFAQRFGKPSVRPPARVIAYGCEAFELDDIPF